MKTLTLFLSSLLISTAVFADEPVKEYKLTLSAQDIAVLGQALISQPYKDAAPLIGKVQTQIQAQDAPKKTPEKKEK